MTLKFLYFDLITSRAETRNNTPFHLTITIYHLHGGCFHKYSEIHVPFCVSFLLFIFAAASNLVLISEERFLSTWHTFTYSSIVITVSLMTSSVLGWIAATLFFLVISYSMILRIFCPGAIISSIVSFQVSPCLSRRPTTRKTLRFSHHKLPSRL